MKNIRKENEKIAEMIRHYSNENNLLLVAFAAADSGKDRRDILHDIGRNNGRIYELSRDLILA